MNNNPMDAFPYLQQMTQQFRQMFGDDFVKNLMNSMQMPMWNGATGGGGEQTPPMGGFGGPGQQNARFGASPTGPREGPSANGVPPTDPSSGQWPNWMSAWNPFEQGAGQRGATGSAPVFPSTDIYETRHELILVMELPGLERASDVRLSVLPDRVIVKGERKRTVGTRSFGTSVTTERMVGPFERTIALPCHVRKQHAKASYTQGLLEIHLLKEGRATDADANFIDVDFL